LRPGTLSYYIEISKYPKEGGGTLGLGTLSYYIEAPKSLKAGGPWDLATRGSGMLPYYIEIPKYSKEGGRTLGPGSCLVISRPQNI